jgi:hypothetical protein
MVQFGIQLGASSHLASGPAAERPYVRLREVGLILRIALVTAAIVFFAACAISPGYMGPDHTPTSRTALRHQYTAFSVAPPRGSGWWTRVSEQEYARAIFHYEMLDFPHTFFVVVEHFSRESDNETIAQFGARFLHHRTDDPERYEVLESAATPDARWGKRCVSYQITLLDHRAPGWEGEALELNAQGFACIHPTFPEFVIVAYYSERGERGRLDPNLQSQGQAFIESVQIESEPGVPAA